jgi:hypothetical protein
MVMLFFMLLLFIFYTSVCVPSTFACTCQHPPTGYLPSYHVQLTDVMLLQRLGKKLEIRLCLLF